MARETSTEQSQKGPPSAVAVGPSSGPAVVPFLGKKGKSVVIHNDCTHKTETMCIGYE